MPHSSAPSVLSAAEEAAARHRAGHRTRRVWTICLVLIVAAVVYDAAAPPEYSSTLILTVVTPLAASALAFRQTLLVAALVLLASAGMQLLLHRGDGYGNRPRELLELAVLLSLVLVALYLCWERTRREAELKTTRAVAEITQRAVLPSVPPRVGGLAVGVRYEPAHAASRIGGDLYAVEDTPFGVRIAIGDVRGKGLSTIRTVAALTGAFRTSVHYRPGLPGVAGLLEDTQHRLAAEGGPEAEERFTTALLAEIARDGRTLRLLNRGHPPPLLVRDGRVVPLVARTPLPPLGLGDLIGGAGDGAERDAAGLEEFDWRPGDVLLLYTDGLTEARDGEGGFFDPATEVRDWDGAELGTLIAAVGDAAIAWSGGRLADDLALVAVRG